MKEMYLIIPKVSEILKIAVGLRFQRKREQERTL